MNSSAKLLTAVFVLALVLAIGWNYYAFFIERDYMVYSEVSCDPETEQCFTWICDEGDEECDDSPYKKLELSAASLPLCDIYTDDACPEPSCQLGDDTCEETYCSEETLEEGEVCTAPEAYQSEDSVDPVAESETELEETE